MMYAIQPVSFVLKNRVHTFTESKKDRRKKKKHYKWSEPFSIGLWLQLFVRSMKKLQCLFFSLSNVCADIQKASDEQTRIQIGLCEQREQKLFSIAAQ